MNVKDHVSMHPPIPAAPKYSPLHHRHHDRGAEMMRRHCMSNAPSNLFGGLEEGLLARAEALAAVDVMSSMVKNNQPHMNIKNDHVSNYSPHHMNGGMHPASHHYGSGTSCASRSIHGHMDHGEFLDPISATASLPGSTNTSLSGADMQGMVVAPPHQSFAAMSGQPGHFNTAHSMMSHNMTMHDLDTDPRELEAFAERFKQRRIKLGVTQCDVGKALANLKLPGVGSLSQSTICRFESLTLSHNNMIALKPILAAWLEEAEAAARDKRNSTGILNNMEKKRKRTSIAAPEKRSLEAYFAVQPRPSSEKIAAIADKLDLKKNVVRVWFCNQRQKQKRMKFSAQPR
ncbi:POU domain, class 4, transcription factor 3-like [Acanthaster planci]|uniref:POU domain protein n=1 Tax=Acanthaster planci TaxID=133434 RepID=A0A8B7XHR1_ACAPL|nr:POU domain, class 4, transcription factor 3-like [Acanthaster planci]